MNEVNVLWTGGWDSTFRVCELIARHQTRVVPHYIIDTGRPSFSEEIRAMERIGAKINERYDPDLLAPTVFVARYDIPVDQGDRIRLHRIRKRHYVGDQYAYLTRYARDRRIGTLEICVEMGQLRATLFEGRLEKRIEGKLDFHVLSGKLEEEMVLFEGFRYPLIDRTKKDMRIEAENGGFLDILHDSWFCYRPVRGKPCGWCTPCASALKKGMGWRMSTLARTKGRLKAGIYDRLGEAGKSFVRKRRKGLA